MPAYFSYKKLYREERINTILYLLKIVNMFFVNLFKIIYFFSSRIIGHTIGLAWRHTSSQDHLYKVLANLIREQVTIPVIEHLS